MPRQSFRQTCRRIVVLNLTDDESVIADYCRGGNGNVCLGNACLLVLKRVKTSSE